MSVYQLTLFVSLNPHPPCFVIPVFNTPSSNQSFAQDLLPSGRIDRFMYFDPGNFTIVPAIAPILDRRIGETGVMAFWLEDDVVLCGPSDHLKSLLSDTGIVAHSPFVEVERATFLEDDILIEEAVEVAGKLLANSTARSTYLQRVHGRIKLLASLRDQEIQPDKDDNEDLNALISLLESEADDAIWMENWNSGWRHLAWRHRLFDVARWRIMGLGLKEHEYSILRDIRYHSASANELFRWWLDNRNPSQPAWALIWSFANVDYDEYSAAQVVRSLTMAFDNRSFRREQWPLLTAWYAIYNMFDEFCAEIEQIAQSNEGKDFYSDYFIEFVVLPIRRRSPDNKWAVDKLSAWFERPVGISLWITSFLREGRRIMGEKRFFDAAIYWLRRYGKGTNNWHELYQDIRDDLSAEESWNLRVAWLRNARKDLYSWPDVFESLADDAGSENFQELSEIARTWSFRGRSRRWNSTIEDFASR